MQLQPRGLVGLPEVLDAHTVEHRLRTAQTAHDNSRDAGSRGADWLRGGRGRTCRTNRGTRRGKTAKKERGET
eukprot:2045490-Pleurochrysis_carterae.AAC.2